MEKYQGLFPTVAFQLLETAVSNTITPHITPILFFSKFVKEKES